jgi:ketosteroid isomerase-like protein
LSAWRDLEFEVQDVLDAGDEVVALIRNQRQWGRHSGIQTEMPPYGLVFTIRNGKMVRRRSFSDHGSALKVVGLSE